MIRTIRTSLPFFKKKPRVGDGGGGGGVGGGFGGGAAPVLAALARQHEVATRAFVTNFSPKVAALKGFDCESRVVAELQAAIEKSKQHNLGYVLLLAGTYLGANGATVSLIFSF